MELWNTDRYL